MKKNRLAAGALALAVSITACGCGDQIYEMTEDEKEAVVHYSAHIVSKFNKKQPEGIQDVAVLKAINKLKEEEAQKRRRERERKEQERLERLGISPEEAAKNQTNPEKPDQNQQSQTGTGQPADGNGSQNQYVSLKKALQLKEVSASYRNYELVSAYQASQSYMVRANSGNELLVLHVNLKNSGSKTAECDILSKMPSFTLKINDDIEAAADTTILLNDLGTWQDRIRAGEKAKTVLIFQVKKGAVKSIKNMDLEVTIGGEASLVHLAG